MNQSDFDDQIRRTPSRKPSAASESFITALAVLFFVGLALLFQFLDRQKTNANHNANIESSATKEEHPEDVSFHSGYPIPDLSTDRFLGNLNTDHFSKENLHSNVRGVHPPLPMLDVKPQKFTVDAGSGLAFTSQRNSVITIPTHAFLDKNGKKVTGNVDVRYREFYNYIDIFRSGIPMIYEYAGKEQQLESAGMFELTASKNNEPVYANPESRISVMMASMTNDPGYNIYFLDQRTNKWIDKGTSIASVTKGNANSFNYTREDYVENKFYYAHPEYTIKISGRWEPGRVNKSLFSTKQTPDRFNFHFAYTKNSIPELKGLRTTVWRYSGPDSKMLFQKIFNKRTGQGVWKNASLVHEEEDDTWLLTLSNDTFTTSLKIVPVLNTEKAVMKFQETMLAYLLEKEARITAQQAQFAKFQSDTIAYFANNPRFTKKTIANQYNIVRQFQIDGFGIWNSDKPMVLQNAVTLNITFKDENNQPIKPQMVYLADKSVNTVFSYDNTRMNRFQFNPKGENMVWAIFPGNIIAVVRPDEFKQKYSSARFRCEIKVNLNQNAIVTEKELKEQLAFDL